MRRNESKKTAFLTDIDFNVQNRDKSHKISANKGFSKTHSVGKTNDEFKFPALSSLPKSTIDKSSQNHQKQAKNNEEALETYVNTLVAEIKRDSLHTKLKNQHKNDISKEITLLNSNFASNFLRQQKGHIEEEIATIYARKTDPELESYLRFVESSPSFQDILREREAELVRVKSEYNTYCCELEKLKERADRAEEKIHRIQMKNQELLPQSKTQREEFGDANSNLSPEVLESITQEGECLENMKKGCKNDILLLRKKNVGLKEVVLKAKDALAHSQNVLQREEEMHSTVTLKLLEIKRGKNTRNKKDFISESIKNDFTYYKDQIKLDQILLNEEKIQLNVKMQEERTKQQRKQRHLDQLEQMKETQRNKVEDLTEELASYNKQLEKLMKITDVSDQMSIPSKINELMGSKETLTDVKSSYNEEIKNLRDEIEKLKELYELDLIEKTADKNSLKIKNQDAGDVESLNLNAATNANENVESLSNETEAQLKEKSHQIVAEGMAYKKDHAVFLNYCSTISRILYQLNPDYYKSINITPDNIIELFDKISGNLGKLATQVPSPKDMQKNEEFYRLNSFSMTGLAQARKPPTWLKLKNQQDLSDHIKETDNSITTLNN